MPEGDRLRARDLVDRGIAAEGAGRHLEAQQFYRDAIALDPACAAAHYNLALAQMEAGEAAQAEPGFHTAIRLRNPFPEAYVGLADALEAQGRNEEALAALGTAITQRENYVGAQLNYGMLLLKMGNPAGAEAALRGIDLTALLYTPDRHSELESIARQLIQIMPDHVQAWRALGTLQALQQRFDEAVPTLRKTLTWLAGDAEVHNNLGAALQALGKTADAEACYRSALELNPGYYEAHNNLGKVLASLDRQAEAETAFRRALELNPEFCDAQNNLGNTLRSFGRLLEAEQCFRLALAVEPGSHLTHNNLAIALQYQGRLSEAEAGFRRALELKPDFYEAHTNLGNVLQALRRYSDAETSYLRALALRPDSAATRSNLGTARRDLGRVAQAESDFRGALELEPHYPDARSNLLFTLNYTDRLSRAEMFEEHLSWGRQHGAPRPVVEPAHANTRAPLRRLRIGYVSPDFRRHSVAYFIEPLLARQDRRKFEVHCYSNVLNPDRMTHQLLGLADHAHSIVGMSDARAADMVRANEIDILVDLAGHTGKGRLGLFALKPAPIQASYLGYPNTTGIAAIDWRITDTYADPPGDGDAFYSERLLRLQNSFLCFRPPDEASEVAPPPCLENGYITFGSFNVLPKITPGVIDLWSQLLQRVPGSRLLLKALGLSDALACERVSADFARRGIAGTRLTLLHADTDFRTHLSRYHQMDIALDPFPYNGTTTTMEALWMGVPVITLAGDRHAGRVGVSILANLGLDELIAWNMKAYLEHAQALANDAGRLVELRQAMRARVSSSPLRDEHGFVLAFESAYEKMWRRWCET